MQGVLIFLLCFFVVSWVLVAGYHLNVDGFVSMARTSTGSSTMVVAYTGAALSVVVAATIALAAVINK